MYPMRVDHIEPGEAYSSEDQHVKPCAPKHPKKHTRHVPPINRDPPQPDPLDAIPHHTNGAKKRTLTRLEGQETTVLDSDEA